MIVTVVIVTVVIMNVVVVMSIVWSSNNGDSTDNCGSKGTRFYWHSQVYMDCVSRSRFRVLFRRGEKEVFYSLNTYMQSHRAKIGARCQHLVPVCTDYWLLLFSLSLSVTDRRQQVLTKQAVSKTTACMNSKTAVYKVARQFILNFHRLPSISMR